MNDHAPYCTTLLHRRTNHTRVIITYARFEQLKTMIYDVRRRRGRTNVNG